MYKYILLDLDGTLTDSGLGITNSVAYALSKYGIDVQDKNDLNKFIGPPLLETFMKHYGFTEEEANKAIEYYREYFRAKGIYENEVYSGIEDMLSGLKASGHTLILATSKPEVFAEIILKHFDLMKYFDSVVGASLDGTLSRKSDVIKAALDRNGIGAKDLSSVIMIGDREHDILGAKDNGLDSIGVTYGFGDYEELHDAGATHIVDSPLDILELV